MRRLWLIAFLFHVPGLRLLTREPLPPRLLPANATALFATVAATFTVAVRVPPPAGAWWAVATFALGHAAWGVFLARRVVRHAATHAATPT